MMLEMKRCVSLVCLCRNESYPQDKLEKIEKAHVSFISYVWEGNWRTGEQISI